MPPDGGASRVWRSWPERTRAGGLIRHTIEQARTHGGRRLVWHTGDGVSPPCGRLAPGTRLREDRRPREVLAFEMGTSHEPRPPELRVSQEIRVRIVENEAVLHRAHAVEIRIFPASTPATPDVRAYLLGLDALRRKVVSTDSGTSPRAFRCLASVREPANGRRETVATAGAELAGETLRLWGAGTFPGHRGRGAYRTLLVEGAATPALSAPPWRWPKPTPLPRPPSSGWLVSGTSPKNAATPWTFRIAAFRKPGASLNLRLI